LKLPDLHLFRFALLLGLAGFGLAAAIAMAAGG